MKLLHMVMAGGYTNMKEKSFYNEWTQGQFVISFPDENIIIVRQGEDNEKGGDGTGDLFQYISEGYKLATAIE